jgi:hypothetical protein
MIDLAYELKEFLDNEAWDHVIIRHLGPTKCFCRSKEADLAKPCCYNCEGTGYVFTEFIAKCKTFYTPRMVAHMQMHEHGLSYKNILVLYMPATAENDRILINDRVFEIKTDLDGNIIDPIFREREWVINDIYDNNLDTGKREFFKLHAKPVLT